MEWSAVVPIYKEVELMKRSIPSYFACEPDEVLICIDDPVPDKRVITIFKAIDEIYPDVNGRIIRVSKDHDYKCHQAWVRRKGFLESKNEIILTGDIDLVLKKKAIYKALRVMKEGMCNGIGLVSLNKFRYPHDLRGFVYALIEQFMRQILHGMFDPVMTTSTFTGLYTFSKSAWLETENQEELKKMINPKQILRGDLFTEKEVAIFDYAGEDTFLRDAMIKKYKAIYLREIGAVDLRIGIENLPYIQYHKGAYFADRGRSFLVSFARAVLRLQNFYLLGFIDRKRGVYRGDALQNYFKGRDKR